MIGGGVLPNLIFCMGMFMGVFMPMFMMMLLFIGYSASAGLAHDLLLKNTHLYHVLLQGSTILPWSVHYVSGFGGTVAAIRDRGGGFSEPALQA